MNGHLVLRRCHLLATKDRFKFCLPGLLFRTSPQSHIIALAMVSSSSKQWSQIVSQKQIVPIQTFQELPLEKNVYNAFQNLKHNSSLAKKLPVLNEQAIRNIGKNLHKFVVDDQAMITNNGPYFKRQQKEWASMRKELKDTRMELKDTRMELKDTRMELKDTRMELKDTRMELKDQGVKLEDVMMKLSNIHTLSCQSEFLNVLRDMVHTIFDKSMPDGVFSEVTRRIREARNLEVHSVTLEGCMNACRSFMAEKDSPLEWKVMFEAFFEVSLDEAETKLIPLDKSFPDFQIKAIMAAQANLLLSCQMNQFSNVFQKWLKAVLEYFDLKQVGHPSSFSLLSSLPSSLPCSTKPDLDKDSAPTKPELEKDSALLCEARKHIQELAVECLRSEKEDRARAASKGMITGFPISKEVLKKRHDKWKEGGQWENIVKLGELYNAAAKGKTGGDKRD
ncbi:hypothetical protein OCU04_012655 [Sclerotinia nivalis]|uniref:Uncharacterized protein n=1 Tax=Sclerotinia nivalis TaxID=352851 RepID=A0A9X0A9E8_9HELO|nr:hypothetical protein OCU04_012655 [Sclerotinia nivalis]